jgi:flagellar biosynthesis protein FlhF
VPVEVVFQPEMLSEAVKAYADKDVVLIDTPGRSPKNRSDMLDLRRFLDSGVQIEVYLVLSANTKYSDLVETLESFKDLAPTNLILTKLDETSSFGSVISMLSRCKKGVSYVTTGQSVPDDIMPASPTKLARLLFEKRVA